MRTIDAIGARLVAVVGVVKGVTLFIGSEADLPDATSGFLVLRETGGQQPLGTHNEGFLATTRPWFQVAAWAGQYPVAAALADKAHAALNGSNVQYGGTSGVFFLSIHPVQQPFVLPPDEGRQRARVAFNVSTWRRGSDN